MATKETDIRILLVGKTGHGKSSTGNSILGQEKFSISFSAKSKTATTEWSGISTRFGKTVEVVDTPGIFDTYRTEKEIQKELIRALIFATPGFHAIAFVLEIGRFTQEIEKTKDIFFKWFGRGIEKYACIILTRTEDEKSVDEYITEDCTEGLKELVSKCGGKSRIAPIENKSTDLERKEAQVKRILDMVEEIKRNNNNTYFTNVAFVLAKEYAYSNCSEEISSGTIHILQGAGLVISDMERTMLDNVFKVNDDDDDDDETDKYETGSDSVEGKVKRNRRKNRRVDIDSVTVTYPGTEDHTGIDFGLAKTDPLYNLKMDIKNGHKDETGLFKHLKKAWIYSKKKMECLIV